MVGVNLVGVFYALYIMIPYGVIVMFGGAIAAFMSPADCQTNQPNRSLYLKLQIVAVFVTLVTSVMHVIVFKIKGVQWCHDVMNREDEEDD